MLCVVLAFILDCMLYGSIDFIWLLFSNRHANLMCDVIDNYPPVGLLQLNQGDG